MKSSEHLSAIEFDELQSILPITGRKYCNAWSRKMAVKRKDAKFFQG